ncbi:hypothetical protein ACTMTF_17305 [Nonomuraea sp. ZG12]|uniref:hypothetical protein n=1 Tax=Nonomuraea sp. ZG12 TaxID=3452207 RepID=UPI003F88BEE6
MRRTWLTALPALLVAGCGIQPTGVIDAGQAPTGVAPGATLYFVDANDRLRPQRRRTDHLGTIPEALSLLLTGPGGGLRTEITSTEGVTRVFVETTPDLIHLRVPLATYEVTPLGIDQIVCTALGVWVQSGGSRTTKVRLTFTLAEPGSDKLRTCPLIR